MCDPLHTKYCVIWLSCLRAIKNDVTQYCRGIQFKTQTCIFLKSTENLIKALVEVNTYCKLNEQRPLLSHPTVFYMLLLPHEKLTPCLELPMTHSCPKHTLQTRILSTNFTVTLHCLIFGVMGMWSSRAKASWGQERWGFFLCWHKHYAVVNLHYFFWVMSYIAILGQGLLLYIPNYIYFHTSIHVLSPSVWETVHLLEIVDLKIIKHLHKWLLLPWKEICERAHFEKTGCRCHTSALLEDSPHQDDYMKRHNGKEFCGNIKSMIYNYRVTVNIIGM